MTRNTGEEGHVRARKDRGRLPEVARDAIAMCNLDGGQLKQSLRMCSEIPENVPFALKVSRPELDGKEWKLETPESPVCVVQNGAERVPNGS